MLRYLIKRPIGVILSFMIVVVTGLLLFNRIPIALLPESDVPVLSIYVNYEDGNADVIENQITKPIRLQMLQVSGVVDVWSTSENGRSELEMKFSYGKDMSLAYIETNEKLDQIISQLPRGMDRPLVNYNSLNDLPVMHVSITPQEQSQVDFTEFGHFSKNVVKRRLEQLSEVAFVDISGYDEDEIRVIPDYNKMQILNITEVDLKNAFENNNLEMGSILLKEGQYQFSVKLRTTTNSIDNLKNIGIPNKGQSIRMGDLAEVIRMPKEKRGMYLEGNNRGILLSILKQPESNIFNLRKEVFRNLEVLEKEYPDVNLKPILDQSNILKVSINNLFSSLTWGGIFAVLILFIFYKKPSTIFLIGIVIPCTIICSLLFYYLFGLSINIITLSGLILGVGLMIDNSIIIIENITQYRQLGETMEEAAIGGTNEVFAPLLSSMLTTCSVFIPLVFMSGIAGSLFYEQALSICISLFMSLLLAFLMIPVLIRLFNFDLAQDLKITKIEKWHHQFLEFSLRRKWLILFVFLLFILGGFLTFLKLEKLSFPEISREGVEFNIDWNQNITFEENEKRCKNLIEVISHYCEEVFLMVGEQQFLLDRTPQNIQQLKVFCIHPNAATQNKLIQEVTKYCETNYPYTQITNRYLQNAFDVIFQADPHVFYIQMQPKNKEVLPNIETIESGLAKIRGNGFEIDPIAQKNVLSLQIDIKKALTYNVNVQNIKNKLKSLLNSNSLGSLNTSNEKLEINIYQKENNFEKLLQNALIPNIGDTLLPLSDFVSSSYESESQKIQATRLGEGYIFPIEGMNNEKYNILSTTLDEIDDFSFSLTGQWFENQQRFKELMWVLGVSLCLLFLILSAQFESMILPIVILVTIPLGIAGSIILLYVCGQALTVLSMIGIVVMTGIMVNDAILKLDMIVRLKSTMGMKDALFEAGKRRVKPILMTSLTTVLALMPILFSKGLGAELQLPLAISVIGGILFGTLSSIFILPLIFLLLTKNWQVFKKSEKL